MAGTYVHGGQPGFSTSFNSVALCLDSFDITINRNVVDAQTNCGIVKTPGQVTSEYSGGGPLGFGAGSDEATMYAHMTATTAVALVFKPSTAAVGAGNPSYTGSVYATQFKLTASPAGNITYGWSAMENNTTGYPTRATA